MKPGDYMSRGMSHEKMTWYGLEYKYLAMYLKGDISYGEMFSKLNTAIHRFAKRQMTWYRKMEKEGLMIRWLDASHPFSTNISTARRWLEG